MKRRSLLGLAGLAWLATLDDGLAFLTPVEDAANARLADSVAPSSELEASAEPRARAAALSLLLCVGEVDRAASIARTLDGLADDCVLRTRRAELLGTAACETVPPERLPEAPADAAPLAARITSPRAGEKGSSFFASVMVSAAQAIGGVGTAAMSSTSDRFQVTGVASLEGLWYLDDRVLVTVRPLGGDVAGARAALDRFAVLRPEHVLGGPALDGGFFDGTLAAEHAPPGRDEPSVAPALLAEVHVDPRGRFRLEVPAGWIRAESTTGLDFRPPAGGSSWIAVRWAEARPKGAETGRRGGRNPVARRPRGETSATLEPQAFLPAGAEVLATDEVPGAGDEAVTSVRWVVAADAGEHRALLRLSRSGTEALGVAASADAVGERALSTWSVKAR